MRTQDLTTNFPPQKGIGRLLGDDTYVAAYPLHDGPFIKPESKKDRRCVTAREVSVASGE